MPDLPKAFSLPAFSKASPREESGTPTSFPPHLGCVCVGCEGCDFRPKWSFKMRGSLISISHHGPDSDDGYVSKPNSNRMESQPGPRGSTCMQVISCGKIDLMSRNSWRD